MIHKKTFQRSKLATGISVALVMSGGLLATQSSAQEEALIEEVIVTSGFRKSIIDSVEAKRNSSSVIESISAEDIGKLPDSSIAESLARLPGLAAQRLDGRASRITIRGFGENESATTFNGREQVSISDNRGVEFDLYPSEIMAGADVYKTPDASLEAEGIAGVVNMRTIRPLEAERRLQLKAELEHNGLGKLNPDGDDNGVSGTFSWVEHFADETIGVAFAYSAMSSPNQENRWNSWGFPDKDVDGTNYAILGGAKPFVRSSTLDRDSAMLVVEIEPSDTLRIVTDALYVDFSDQKILRGIEVPFAWGQGSQDPDSFVIDSASGLITSAVTKGQRVVVRNDYEERNAKLKSFGFNAELDYSDSLTFEFDVSHSQVDRQIYSLESYAGTGRGDAEGAPDTIGYTLKPGGAGAIFDPGLDYSDNSLILLGGPLTWGWQSSLNEKFGATGTDYENAAQDGFLNAPEIDDELTALKFAAKQVVDAGAISDIEYGVSYRDRTKSKLSDGYFMTLTAFPSMLPVPTEYDLGSVSLDFIGMGDMIAYNPMAMIRDGRYSLTQETANHATNSWEVSEEVISLFAMANIDTEFAGMPLSGNVGIRYVRTEQSSRGNAVEPDGIVVQNVSHDYSNILPSLNLKLELDDTQSLRFGAAKTMSRPRMDEMNASFSVTASPTPDENGNYISANGGNTSLEPKEALGVDLTYENYFSEEGYFSVALFWKDLDQWIFDGNSQIDVSDYLAAANAVTANGSTSATVYGKVNGGDGTLKGYEVSLSLPLSMLSESLDGWGLIASHTGVSSDINTPDGNEYQLPGLSDSIQNATVYYEKNGLQLRASMRKRDDFKGEVYGLGFSTNQVDILGETIVDAQIAYDFGDAGISGLEGLSVYLQGSNLTDEPFISTQGSALKTRDYQEYGKNYRLGFSYMF